jgi:hypothetical protein
MKGRGGRATKGTIASIAGGGASIPLGLEQHGKGGGKHPMETPDRDTTPEPEAWVAATTEGG